MGQNISNIIKYDKSGKQVASFNIDNFIPSPVIIADDFIAFTGIKRESVSFFYLQKNDLKLYDNIDFSNVNLLNSYPAVTSSNTLKFTSRTSPKIVMIKSSLLDLY
jgi:hypothetical protein